MHCRAVNYNIYLCTYYHIHLYFTTLEHVSCLPSSYSCNPIKIRIMYQARKCSPFISCDNLFNFMYSTKQENRNLKCNRPAGENNIYICCSYNCVLLLKCALRVSELYCREASWLSTPHRRLITRPWLISACDVAFEL